jgi:Sulfatase-modifying factor enzyme 1
MKFYPILGFLFLSVSLRGQESDMKRQLKTVLERYADHWSYFVAQDTKGRLEVTRNFGALFTSSAQIYDPNNQEYLSPAEYAIQIHNFSANTTLIINQIQFCRQDALFYVYYRQGYNGDCLHCETKDLPALYYRMSVVQVGGKWLISNIEQARVQSRLPDADNDGIPNDCDKCPNTVGTLEYFGDDPYNSCNKPQPEYFMKLDSFNSRVQMGNNNGNSDEKPVHTGENKITVRKFRAFIEATRYQTDAEKEDGSYIWKNNSWTKEKGIFWKHDAEGNIRPASEDNHPVMHVSLKDLLAYCTWLLGDYTPPTSYRG